MHAATLSHSTIQPDMVDKAGFEPICGPQVLHYAWWERLAQQRDKVVVTATFNQAEAAFASAEQFISQWAQVAEQHGCQPVHLLRPPSAMGVDDGGLAWRCGGVLETVGVAKNVVVIGGSSGLARIYRLQADGGLSMIKALPREGVVGEVQRLGGTSHV